MNMYAWAVLVWLVLGLLIYIGKVGKPRDPVKPWEAVVGAVEFGLVGLLVVLAVTA